MGTITLNGTPALIDLPRADQRCVIIGPTGSGKTVVAKWLLDQHRNVIVVDPKGHWKKRPQDLEAKSLRELHNAGDVAADTGQTIVYRVPREHLLPEHAAQLDDVAKFALEREHTLLYYDELVFVAGGSDFFKRAKHYYFAVTTGRSKKVGVWSATQRPTWVPLIALSESDIRIAFYMRRAADKQRVEELLGEVPWGCLAKHRHAWVIGNDQQTSSPMRLHFGTAYAERNVSVK